jgi:hypothetical protein
VRRSQLPDRALGSNASLYVLHNTVAQHFAADGEPLVLLSGQKRIFKMLGYDNAVYLENAPEYDGAETSAAVH